MRLSKDLDENIKWLHEVFPLDKSFDLITRELYLGETRAFFLAINGFIKAELLQKLFSDLQNPLYSKDLHIDHLETYMNAKIGYAQISLCEDPDKIIKDVLSGPSVLFIDGFSAALLIDTRTYPARSIEEPDTEKVTKGAKDGFVETLLFNTNLIRRRIRNPRLTFAMKTVGSDSKTDVAIAYIDGIIDEELLDKLNQKLDGLKVTSLTMGSKSLEELLVKKRLFNPLPSFHSTERPDVACSYLLEGHMAIIVDNSPAVLILPCTIFEFTQSPEDYYKSLAVGNYVRLIRFVSSILSLFLLPVFLVLAMHADKLPETLHVIATDDIGPVKLFIYVLFIEFGLDLFNYSSSHAASGFSNSLGIIGGLIISDIAIELKWASLEVIFYGAATLLLTLSLSSIEFGEAIRIYRIFLILLTGFFGIAGFAAGILLIFISVITTPVFGGKSYFWPLYPFNWKALKTLMFRYPTPKAQPSKIWKEK